MDTLDKGIIHIQAERGVGLKEISSCYSSDTQFKIYELFTSRIFQVMSSYCGSLQVTEAKVGTGELLYYWALE